MTRCTVALGLRVDSFDCCTERYEIVVYSPIRPNQWPSNRFKVPQWYPWLKNTINSNIQYSSQKLLHSELCVWSMSSTKLDQIHYKIIKWVWPGNVTIKNRLWVWSGNTTITNCRLTHGTARKSRSTTTRHKDHKLSKATSSLFPIKMIAILIRTQSSI